MDNNQLSKLIFCLSYVCGYEYGYKRQLIHMGYNNQNPDLNFRKQLCDIIFQKQIQEHRRLIKEDLMKRGHSSEMIELAFKVYFSLSKIEFIEIIKDPLNNG